MGFFTKWDYDPGRSVQSGEEVAFTGERHKTPPIMTNSVAVFPFTPTVAGVATIAVYEAEAGKNYMRVAWISEIANGKPLPGPASWLCPSGVQRGLGVNLQVDIGNTKGTYSFWGIPMLQHVELELGKEYWLNIMNEDGGGKSAGFTLYPPTA